MSTKPDQRDLIKGLGTKNRRHSVTFLPEPGRRPRYEPGNLDLAGGLDRWDLDAGPGSAPDSEPDYAADAEADSAVLSSSAPRPAGSAALVQAIFADDHRGATVVFRGELRTEDVADQAALTLRIITSGPLRPGPDHYGTAAAEDHDVTVTGSSQGWTRHEITAQVPGNADLIQFGITLTGPGRVALRSTELTRTD